MNDPAAAPSSSPRAALPWHRRLEARVLIGVGVIASVSLIALLLATERLISEYSLERSRQDLQAARAAFYQLVESRTRFAASQARLIAELPVFRAHMTDARIAADAATLHEMAEGYRKSLAADFCIVTDARGTSLAHPGWPLGLDTTAGLRADIEQARTGRSHSEILSLQGRLYLVVIEPALFAQEVLGVVAVGYALNDDVARELARVTNCDVNLVSSARLAGSSLPLDARDELAALLPSTPVTVGSAPPTRQRLGGEEYLSGVYPLRPDGTGDASLVLLRPLGSTQALLDQMRRSLLWVGAITSVIGVCGILFVSHRVTKPLRHLATMARQIAAGRWDIRVAAQGTAEAVDMATAFNEMTASLSHWHAEAREQTDRLQILYERFLSVTESANDAIVSADAGGRIVFWNRRAQAMFGYSQEDALGRPLTLILPEDQGISLESMLQSTSHHSGRTIEVVGRARNGSAVPLELSLSSWKAGEDVFCTMVMRDITERKHAEVELRQREEQLRQAQKLEAIGRLAGGVAHDFNNMLMVINSYSELLLNDSSTGSDAREQIVEIRKAGERAASLTRQLLAFSRKQVLAPEVVELGTIVRSMDTMLRRLIGEDVALVTAIEPKLGSVKADPGQIEQVIMNLAVNARDAMPDGGTLRIECCNVDVRPDGPRRGGVPPGVYVVLEVTDTGSGMDALTRSRIFEPFFTTKEEGKGTGLGLAMVYGFVQQSGGFIDVQSEPGRGAAFKIFLPRVQAEAPAAETVQPAAPLPGSETILLVEDETSVRNMIRNVLRSQGYAVIEAAHPDEAIAVSGRHPGRIDVLLTDLIMPGMNGRTLAERLVRERPSMKVLFMSGYAGDALADGRVGPTAPILLQKPFSPLLLARAIRDALAAESA